MFFEIKNEMKCSYFGSIKLKMKVFWNEICIMESLHQITFEKTEADRKIMYFQKENYEKKLGKKVNYEIYYCSYLLHLNKLFVSGNDKEF